MNTALDKNKNKLALITGGSRGIGAAISGRLAADGFEVILTGRHSSTLKVECDRIISLGGAASFIKADLAKTDEVLNLCRKIKTHYKRVDLLINNAGFGGPFHKVNEISEKEWDMIFQVNLKSSFLLCKDILPLMKKSGFGRVINISSVQGLFGAESSSTYASSKHALLGFTRSVAAEWGQFGITCNVICPGFIDTEMLVGHRARKSTKLKALLKRIPIGRFGTPEEIAAIVSLLCSPTGGYFNGSVITVDGGLSAHID